MAEANETFEHCLRSLRDLDRDRYLACLLTPEAHRGPFAALYAFNGEIARVRDVIHEPMPGEVRLQWWRDLVAGNEHGQAAANPVAAGLMETIRRHDLPRQTFDNYIEARIFDLYDDAMPDRTAFEGYAGETVSAIMQLCAMTISPDAARKSADLAGHAGVALAVAGSILLLPIHRARGQVYVPGDILAATGLDRQSFLAATDREACKRAVDAFVALGNEHLARAREALRTTPEDIFPAFLPAAIAGPVLRRAGKASAALFEEGLTPAQWRRQWWLWRAARLRRF
ncbi:phytoene/squalene synthase family protein [Pararhizobium mangrovi]|uniref:Phytoene/squalene synthase family protein n=1 Tax=Pararhizobium mangrovi TaxID=2590452 RepID=A0A506U919_9HYPH|nr:phytoene/squalene synthase family protein [Pararhizobium mangrovi]TPW29581.1 phytoene/squalene synthase family protein [Pararhizobium mangrovi]